ncbi:MAG: MotA/TolQ/ExbB proton channel family protein, partial [Burkholderiales bacterium]|nr:MotA/TolQ/ExbB proton channel family protein [Burkholderiales bacterium]
MAFMLFVALTVSIERAWYLRKVISHGKKIMAEIEPLSRVDG